MKPKVIVTRRWPAEVEARLQEKYDVTLNASDHPMSVAEFKSALQTYDAVLTTVTDGMTPDAFEGLSLENVRTKIIGNYGVGFSHIDVSSAKRLNLTVTNTPDVLSECTADIAILLMLMAARRGGEGEREVRSGNWTGWRPTHMIGSKVSGGVFGVLGFGRIGREAAQRAMGFGMSIKVFNRSKVPSEVLQAFNAEQVGSINELAEAADFLSLHCPGGAENTHLINAEVLARMKPTGYIINTARGEVVDDVALVEALKNGVIAGAGLDVFQGEPAINPDLLTLDNVVLLPHLGSATSATREAMGFRVIENIDAFFNGSEPPDRVV